MATTVSPKLVYPRPPLQHEDLFKEPVYTDGQPYNVTDDEGEEPAAIITP